VVAVTDVSPGPREAEVSAPPVVAPPPGHPRFPLIDSCRAIAALGVLVGHVGFVSNAIQTHSYGPALALGNLGVTLFFLISGFLLYRPFVNAQLRGARRPTVREFFRRRILRIVPAYWLALTVIAIYPGLSLVFGHHWWRFYGFGQVYNRYEVEGGLVQAWSLCVEMSFYLVLPLYAFAMGVVTRRMGPQRRLVFEMGCLVLLAAGSVVLRFRALGTTSILPNTLPGYLLWFALGMTMATASVVFFDREATVPGLRLVVRRPGLCWTAALVLYGLLCAITYSAPLHTEYSRSQWFAQHTVGALLCFLILLPAVFGGAAGGWPRRVLAWRLLAWLGLISYGIYLWHGAAATVLTRDNIARVWPSHPLVPLFVGTVALAVACASASYYVVERPILRFKYRRGPLRLPRSPGLVADPKPD
jgi:peptidoglycan/LPS O-acetylase OafA/YrhL